MCGTGNRVCGICANAGGCLASMHEDYFCLASKQEVQKRLEEGRYTRDTLIMKQYLEMPDNYIRLCMTWA